MTKCVGEACNGARESVCCDFFALLNSVGVHAMFVLFNMAAACTSRFYICFYREMLWFYHQFCYWRQSYERKIDKGANPHRKGRYFRLLSLCSIGNSIAQLIATNDKRLKSNRYLFIEYLRLILSKGSSFSPRIRPRQQTHFSPAVSRSIHCKIRVND